MKKSVIGPEFEKQDAVPPYSESKQASKLKRKVSLRRDQLRWTFTQQWKNYKSFNPVHCHPGQVLKS